jgi:hypothetical protein
MTAGTVCRTGKSLRILPSDNDEMLGPSMKVAQEGIGFINRED